MKRQPLPILPLLSVPEAAYIAGFVDGEGSISIMPVAYKGKKTKGVRVCVSIVQTDPRPIHWMHKLIGGSVSLRQPSNGLSKKPIWDLRLCDRKVEQFLPQIIPYLMVKKEKAELALAVRTMINSQRGKNKGLTPEQSETRLRLIKSAENGASFDPYFMEQAHGNR